MSENNKENSSYYYPAEKSHWEKFRIYYLVFGSFFFTTLIILISNSNTSSQIKEVNQRLDQVKNDDFPDIPFSPRNQNDHGYKSGDFVYPSVDQKNEKWLEETVFQNNVRQEFRTWVNSVKYLPRYRIGGQQEPERHALFYGPPGSGKSYLAEMFAQNESLAYVFAKFGTETYSGSSQQKVNKVVEEAKYLLKQKGNTKPVVIVIDEMDSVGIKQPGSGGSFQETNAILTMIDDVKRDKLDIIVIGITNYPSLLDPALKRAGRFGRQIEVPFLTKEEITKMVKYLENDMKNERIGAYKYEGNRTKWDKDKDKDKEIEWTNDFWSEVLQITFEVFDKCQQAEVGISYTDLELSIKDALAEKVSEGSKKITPQSSDFKKEVGKKVADKIRDKKAREPGRLPDRNPQPRERDEEENS